MTPDKQHPIISKFRRFDGVVPAGCQSNWLGVFTDVSFFVQYREERAMVERPEYPDLPKEDDEYHELVDVLEAVDSARDQFTMMELGAGFGRWLVMAGVAAKQRPGLKVKLIGVEAEPTHFQMMVRHFQRNGLNPVEHILLDQAVAPADGEVSFIAGHAEEWYGQIIAKDLSGARQYPNAHLRTLPAVSLNTLLEPYGRVDLIDADIQGSEIDVFPSAPEALNKKVKRVHIGTHSAAIEEGLRQFFRSLNWTPVNDFAIASTVETRYGSIVFGDGVQTWINPALQ